MEEEIPSGFKGKFDNAAVISFALAAFFAEQLRFSFSVFWERQHGYKSTSIRFLKGKSQNEGGGRGSDAYNRLGTGGLVC